MSLQDLEKKIYKQDSENAQNDSEKVDFQNRAIRDQDVNKPEEFKMEDIKGKVGNQAIKELRREKKRKKVFVWIVVIAAVLFAGSSLSLYYFLKNRSGYRDKDITFNLEYPEEIISGEKNKIIIKYGNYSKVGLKNVSISFHYPSSLNLIEDSNGGSIKDWDIENVAAGEEKTIEIPFRIFGEEGSAHVVESSLEYTPENFNSIFKKSANAKIKISGFPIRVSLDAPKEISSGGKIKYSISCENLTDEDFYNLALEINFPEEFIISSIIFKESEEEDFKEMEREFLNNRIDLNKLEPLGKVTYNFLGNLGGEVGFGKIVNVQVGFEDSDDFYVYNSAETSTLIKGADVLLEQTVVNGQDSANWGEVIEFKIKAKNTSEVGLSGVVVAAQVEGDAADIYSLSSKVGAVSSGGKIIWNSYNIPEFAYFLPSQEKELTFSVKIKSGLSIKNFTDKNFVISSIPNVEAVELEDPIFGSKVDVKINSNLVLAEKGFYWEDGAIKNQGPIPPRIGQTTTYTIHWQLVNWTNDLSNGLVSAQLPAGIGWSNNTTCAHGSIGFNNVTRTIVWDIGDIPANVGIISPVYEAVFQISINPAESDVGKALKIVGNTTASGADSFTGKKLIHTVKEKTTELPEDGQLKDSDFKVAY